MREAGGVVSALSDASIGVRDGKRTATCAIGRRAPSLQGIAVGDRVQMLCRRRAHAWVLLKIRELPQPPEPVKAAGVVSTLSDASISVARLTCAIPDRLAEKIGRLHVGDRVTIACVRGTLVGVERLPGEGSKPKPEPGPEPVTLAGAVSALSAGAISVHGERDLTCSVPAAYTEKLSTNFKVGDKVKIACTGGVLTAIGRLEEPKPSEPKPPTPPSTQPGMAAGVLTSIRGDGLTVHGETGDLPCRTTDGSPSLAEYHLGDRVKIACEGGVLTAIYRL